MKHFRFTGVGIAVLAVLVFSAMAVASSASAAVTFLLALWLEGGANVVETMLVTTTGELTLLNSNAPIVKTDVSVLCSGTLHGFVGPNSADEVTELLSLGGTAISGTPLVEPALECESLTVCSAGSALVWAVNLPWLTELELWEEGAASGFVDLILPHTGGGNVGWYIDCTVLGVLASEECTTPEGVVEQLNVATGVESVFSEAFTLLMGAKLALCSGNNEETGVVSSAGNANGITVNSLAGVLSASS
jgi:hypothetical protein